MKILCWKESGLSKNEIVEFMKVVGNELPKPLASRKNIHEYVEKIIKYGEFYILMDFNNMPSGILAFYANDYEKKAAYLSILSILSARQKQGYGRELMAYMILRCSQLGMTTISLDVQTTNKRAINFYKKLGFKSISVKDDKILMLKKLDS